MLDKERLEASRCWIRRSTPLGWKEGEGEAAVLGREEVEDAIIHPACHPKGKYEPVWQTSVVRLSFSLHALNRGLQNLMSHSVHATYYDHITDLSPQSKIVLRTQMMQESGGLLSGDGPHPSGTRR